MADDESICVHYKASTQFCELLSSLAKKDEGEKNQKQARSLAGMPGRILKQK